MEKKTIIHVKLLFIEIPLNNSCFTFLIRVIFQHCFVKLIETIFWACVTSNETLIYWSKDYQPSLGLGDFWGHWILVSLPLCCNQLYIWVINQETVTLKQGCVDILQFQLLPAPQSLFSKEMYLHHHESKINHGKWLLRFYSMWVTGFSLDKSSFTWLSLFW